MRCGKIGTRSGLPCLRLNPDHPGGCRFHYYPKMKTLTKTKRRTATLIPDGELPQRMLDALDRYAAADMLLPGDTLVPKLRRKLRDRI